MHMLKHGVALLYVGLSHTIPINTLKYDYNVTKMTKYCREWQPFYFILTLSLNIHCEDLYDSILSSKSSAKPNKGNIIYCSTTGTVTIFT